MYILHCCTYRITGLRLFVINMTNLAAAYFSFIKFIHIKVHWFPTSCFIYINYYKCSCLFLLYNVRHLTAKASYLMLVNGILL